jgi:hypothetical protein
VQETGDWRKDAGANMTNAIRWLGIMRPFQGRGGWRLPAFTGGGAPGYYMVPLRGTTTVLAPDTAHVTMAAESPKGIYEVAGGNAPRKQTRKMD